MADGNGLGRLLAKLTRDILATESFDTLADLADVLEYRCATLRIHPAPDDISQAFAMVGSNRLLAKPPATLERRVSEPELRPAVPGVSRADAAAILARLGIVL